MTALIASLAATLALGWTSTRLLLGAPGAVSESALQGMLALGLGLGIASCTLFLTGVLADGLGAGALTFEGLALVSAAGAAWVLTRRRPRVSAIEPAPRQSPKALIWVLAVAFLLIVGLVLWRSLSASSASPHGEWDAWAVWNVRARFFVRAPEEWTGAFLVSRGHPDYPLFLPLTIARFWAVLGSETTIVPRVVSIGSAFACVALLVSALATLRGRGQALLAGIVLLSTQSFVVLATWQVADTSLAFFYLGTFVSLAIADAEGDADAERGHRAWALAGAMAGLAAWTKNEGMLFALLVVASTAAYSMRGAGWKRVAAVLAGIAPFAAVVLLFKVGYAPASDLTREVTPAILFEKLADLGRYQLVTDRFIRYFAAATGAFTILIPLYVLSRRGWRSRSGSHATAGRAVTLTVFGGTLVGYFFVYILTPYDLSWHLRTALPRLVMQLWPCLLFVVFLAASSEEDASHLGIEGATSP